MQGHSHYGVAVAGSIAINNLISLFHFPATIGVVLHAAGAPILWPQVVHGVQSPQQIDWTMLAHRFTFYFLAVYFARLPDRDQKIDGCAHRGCTHSLFGLLFLVGGFLLVTWMGGNYLHNAMHTQINPFWQREIGAIFMGFFSAVLLHILADMMTVQGVMIWWPGEGHQGLLPKGMRFHNASAMEYVVVWSFIGVIAYLIGRGVIGL